MREKAGMPFGAPREPKTRAASRKRIAARLHSICHPAQFILPLDSKPQSGHCRVKNTRRVSAINSPPTETIPPGLLPQSPSLPTTHRRPHPAAGTPLCKHLHSARQPFRRCPRPVHLQHETLCPAPPVSTQTERPLPCSRSAELPLAPTQATLPHYGI